MGHWSDHRRQWGSGLRLRQDSCFRPRSCRHLRLTASLELFNVLGSSRFLPARGYDSGCGQQMRVNQSPTRSVHFSQLSCEQAHSAAAPGGRDLAWIILPCCDRGVDLRSDPDRTPPAAALPTSPADVRGRASGSPTASWDWTAPKPGERLRGVKHVTLNVSRLQATPSRITIRP